MNIQALKNYLNCDNNFLLNLVQTFIEEATLATRKIELALQNENAKSIQLNAHKLLGSVKILELSDLIILLEKIEKTANKQPDSPDLKSLVQQLSFSVKKTIYDIQLTLEELES